MPPPHTPARLFALALALVLALASSATGSPQADEPAARPGGPLSWLELNDGQRWSADPALRSGMESLRHTLEAAMADPDDRLEGLAEVIRADVERIDRETLIPARARSQLDVILGELLVAADEMASASPLDRHEGLARAIDAVDAYGRFFEHPGWPGLTY